MAMKTAEEQFRELSKEELADWARHIQTGRLEASPAVKRALAVALWEKADDAERAAVIESIRKLKP